MLSEEFVSSVCGPPLTSNTAVAKDAGIYSHTVSPAYSVNNAFKKSSTPVNCLAANDSHIFAAQHEKAYVHVYSRLRGNQEAFVPFPERIRCLTLAGDVLVLGTAEGRLMLWEFCTGRLVSTPARHVQAVSCVASTPYHVITGSEDSDIHVWSLSHLLDLDSQAEHEPQRSLSNHRAAITSLAAAPGSSNPDTSICVSASRDKSCIIWNHLSGTALRTILLPAFPLCVALDPSCRALFASCEDGSLFMAEFFAARPLLGPAAEDPATVVQLSAPFGAAPPDAGPASCLAVSYDGTHLLTGHPRGHLLRWDVADNRTPAELANLNAAVTNLQFLPPLRPAAAMSTPTIVKPAAGGRGYAFAAQLGPLSGHRQQPSRLQAALGAPGFPQDFLEGAVAAFERPVDEAGGEQQEDLARQNEELWGVINEQRALQKETLQKYIEAKAGR